MTHHSMILGCVLGSLVALGCSSTNSSTSSSSSGTSTSTTTSGSSSSSSTGSTSSATGSTTGGASSAGSSGSTTGSSTGTPPPTLGTQIDRMGRPAINTAVSDPFDPSSTAEDAAKDAYNANSDPTTWVSAFTPQFISNLAILDGLDAKCGNQVFATLPDGGYNPSETRYTTLASVLADDRLWVNTASGTCVVYLAVEANATGLISNNDCGGRTPLEDVIDESYSLLAAGTVSGVTDGINQDADGPPDLSTFPFLNAAH